MTWLKAHPRTMASGGVVTAAVVTLGTLAFVYEGKPTTEVDLHDGSVWLTKQSTLYVGHFNNESALLDGGFRTASSSYDILQDGGQVLVVEPESHTVTVVNTQGVALGESTELPPGATVRMGGGKVAVTDPSGAVWITPFANIGSFSPKTLDPIGEFGKGVVSTVGVDGVVHVASPANQNLTSFSLNGAGEVEKVGEFALEGLDKAASISISAVGSTPIVHDATKNQVHRSGADPVDVPAGSVIQAPSSISSALTVSTPTSLLRIPLDGSEPTEVAAGGASGGAATPVYVEGCAYGAWSQGGQVVRTCEDGNEKITPIEGMSEATKLSFRVNRDVVVLNDVVGGSAWMASENMQQVDNWDDLTPPEGEGEEEEETTEETQESTLPERTDVNTPPVAENDTYGARPGRSTVLTILDNDTDADGDVLVASVVKKPAFGEIVPIFNGAAFQITLDEKASGTTSFTYKVEDGRGGEATARVQLAAFGEDVNTAPVQKRKTPIIVEAGGEVSYNVMADWIDPEGDDIYLVDVFAQDGDEATFSADGQINYRAIGGVQGRKDVPVTFSDGTDTAAGVARLDIRPVGSTVPLTNADHVVVREGRTVTVSPLTNDSSSSNEPLRLGNVEVEGVEGAKITPDYSNKSFTFSAAKADVYYVQYLATAGPNSVPGVVRVDVVPAADSDAPPVAVRDVALLKKGGDVLVNVLGNDFDPSGGILVVQSATVDPGARLGVAVLGHDTIRITDAGNLQRQTRVAYTVSNGKVSVEGEIIVIPIDRPTKLRPPIANDDTAVVRAGDVVSIPVLKNDQHPNGDTLTVVPELVENDIDPADGELFVTENMLRFRAGNEPKTVRAVYEAADSEGQRDAAYVSIQILPLDDDANAAPRPHDLTARTVSGSAVHVSVPLDGIDEDGDSVELVGLETSPSKGRVEQIDANTFRYEAFADSTEVDSFRYLVRDRLGREGTANIQVGIAPAASVNQAPYAVKDAVVMRPERTVDLDVLVNDSDPDGEPIGFAQNAVTVPEDVKGLEVVAGDKMLAITSPSEEVATSAQYTITDPRGLTATTSVSIVVDETVPLIKPVARDDRIGAELVQEDGTAQINVLDNDDDLDGQRSALKVELGAGGDTARVNAEGVLSVTLTDENQLITYSVTDRDDLTSSAFIFVPALDELPPTLTELGTRGVEVVSGETIELPLAEYVSGAGGKKVIITEFGKVKAAHSNGENLIKNESTLVYTSADRYQGSDALTFEVTDGSGVDDENGTKATLTIPINVLPPKNMPPEVDGSSVQVAPGEQAVTLELSGLATDPDPDDVITFALVGSAPTGFDASVADNVLSVSAPAGTPKGTQATLTVSASDGENPAVEAPITVTVTASTRELPAPVDDVVEESDQGETVVYDVLKNDVNPFQGEGPLTIVNAVPESGDVASVNVSGSNLEVTSAPDFVGTIVVRYRVEDVTKDVDRQMDGRLTIKVQGRPDQPGKPTVSSIQSRTVVLSWSAPSENGTPITGYTVAAQGKDYVKECASTTCTLDGLTNNVEYNFVVTATNRVGISDPSLPSETARPDVRPEKPLPPTLNFGDRKLDIAWQTPATEGSPVESYTLQISPTPPSGQAQRTVTGNAFAWEGLQNGVSYTVQVRAHNRAPEPSDFSEWSQPMVPAAPPAAPNAPSSQRVESVGTSNHISVSWNAPANNGDAIARYQLDVLRGGSVVNTVYPNAGQTSQTVTLATSQTPYTFRVRAENKAGWGEFSAQSGPRQSFGAEGAPSGVSAREGDGVVTVQWTPGSVNGAPAGSTTYQFSLNGGAWSGGWRSGGTSNQGTISVSNNTKYTVRVRAVSTVQGATEYSAESGASNQFEPYGPIGAPAARATANGTTINMTWSSPARNGRDIKTEIRTSDGRGWRTVDPSGTESYNVGHSVSKTLYVRTTAAGQTTTAEDTARTPDAPPPPQPRVWVTQGSAAGSCVNGCRNLVVNTQNFPGGSYRVGCVSDNDGDFNGYKGPYNIPSNGSVQLQCHVGRDGQNVWVDIYGWGDTVDTEKNFWARP